MVCFKQIKRTLQMADFLGHNADAVRWQVRTTLLTYPLLRYLRVANRFTPLFTILSAVLWSRLDAPDVLGAMGQQAAVSALGPPRLCRFRRFPLILWDSNPP